MGVRQTSLNAYNDVKEKIGKKQREVLNIIEDAMEPVTNMEIAEKLRWSINRVTPRVLELRKDEKVEQHGERRCKITGRTAMTWKAKQD